MAAKEVTDSCNMNVAGLTCSTETLNKEIPPQGWRDGSVSKSTGCFYGGPEFDFQHPYTLQFHLMPISGLYRHEVCIWHTCRQINIPRKQNFSTRKKDKLSRVCMWNTDRTEKGGLLLVSFPLSCEIDYSLKKFIFYSILHNIGSGNIYMNKDNPHKV